MPYNSEFVSQSKSSYKDRRYFTKDATIKKRWQNFYANETCYTTILFTWQNWTNRQYLKVEMIASYANLIQASIPVWTIIFLGWKYLFLSFAFNLTNLFLSINFIVDFCPHLGSFLLFFSLCFQPNFTSGRLQVINQDLG